PFASRTWARSFNQGTSQAFFYRVSTCITPGTPAFPFRSTAVNARTSGGGRGHTRDIWLPGRTSVLHSPPARACNTQSHTFSAPPVSQRTLSGEIVSGTG